MGVGFLHGGSGGDYSVGDVVYTKVVNEVSNFNAISSYTVEPKYIQVQEVFTTTQYIYYSYYYNGQPYIVKSNLTGGTIWNITVDAGLHMLLGVDSNQDFYVAVNRASSSIKICKYSGVDGSLIVCSSSSSLSLPSPTHKEGIFVSDTGVFYNSYENNYKSITRLSANTLTPIYTLELPNLVKPDNKSPFRWTTSFSNLAENGKVAILYPGQGNDYKTQLWFLDPNTSVNPFVKLNNYVDNFTGGTISSGSYSLSGNIVAHRNKLYIVNRRVISGVSIQYATALQIVDFTGAELKNINISSLMAQSSNFSVTDKWILLPSRRLTTDTVYTAPRGVLATHDGSLALNIVFNNISGTYYRAIHAIKWDSDNEVSILGQHTPHTGSSYSPTSIEKFFVNLHNEII